MSGAPSTFTKATSSMRRPCGISSARPWRSISGLRVSPSRSPGEPAASGPASTEELLAKVIVGMTISLDGFVADQNGNAGRLYPDLAALRHTAYMQDAIEQTGAVLMGEKDVRDGGPRLLRGQL